MGLALATPSLIQELKLFLVGLVQFDVGQEQVVLLLIKIGHRNVKQFAKTRISIASCKTYIP